MMKSPKENPLSVKQIEQSAQKDQRLSKHVESTQDLRIAFEAFCQHTNKLEKTYALLETRHKTVEKKLFRLERELQSKISELECAQAYFHALLTNMYEGVIFIESSGLVSTLTPRAQQLLNLPSDMEGKYIKDYLEDTHFGFSLTRHLKNKLSPENCLLTIPSQSRKTHSTVIEISGSFVTLGTKPNHIQGLLIIARDLTALHKLQASIERNERLKSLGELAASLAHEIRNPLGGIEGFASLLTRDLKNQPDQLRMAEHIVQGAKAVNHLVTRVLDYARPIQVDLKRQDIIQTLHYCIEMAIASEWVKPKQLYLCENKNTAKITHDKQLIQACILNLIKNASEAIGPKGKVEIRVYEDEKEISIQILDNGKGIEAQDIEKVFSPFFTTKTKGSGLGLSEVHKMMQSQGGRVEVTSSTGRGSCFSLILPKSSPLIQQN